MEAETERQLRASPRAGGFCYNTTPMEHIVIGVLKFYASLQCVPALLARNWPVVVLILVLTLLFGRVYCRFVCPLGILQSLVRGFRGPRRVCSRLRLGYGGRVRVALSWGILIAVVFVGLMGWGWQWLDPYAIATRGICVGLAPEFDIGVVAFAALPLVAILLLSVFVGGRIWCNWVCPVGTLLSFVARFSWKGDRIRKCRGCDRCRRCFPPSVRGTEGPASAEKASGEGDAK